MNNNSILDLNQFLQNFEKEKENLQKIINATQTNSLTNVEPQITPNQTQNPPNYAYFLNPNYNVNSFTVSIFQHRIIQT